MSVSAPDPGQSFASEPSLLERLPIGFYRRGSAGKLLYANPAMARIYGFPDADGLLAADARSLYPDDANRAWWQASVEHDEGLRTHELRQLRRDGGSIWVRETVQCVRDPGGRVLHHDGLLEDITEQRNAKEGTRTAGRSYESLVDSIDGIVWEADARTFRFTFVSRKAERLLGYPVEQWLTQPDFWRDHLHPDDRDWAVSFCLRATAEGRAHDFEYRMIASDGRAVWLRDIVAVVVENGETLGLRGVMVDVTDKKQADEALRRSEERFRQMADRIGEVFWMADPHAPAMLYVSPAYETIWGRSCRSLYEAPRSYLDGIHPEDRPGQMAALRRQVEGEDTDEQYRVVRPDGSIRWVRDRAFPIKDPSGRVYRITGIAEDVTERKRAEEALRDSEERYRMLVESAPEAIIMIDLEDGRFVDANENAVRLFGFPREVLLGMKALGPAPRLSPPTQPDGRDSLEAGAEVIRDAVNGGTPVLEWTFRNAAGLDLPCEIRLVRLPAAGRGLLRGSITDISERKKADAMRVGQSRILEMIAAGAPLEETLVSLVRLVESQSEGVLCSILLLDEDGVHVRHGAAPGLPEAYTKAIDGACIGPRAGSCGTAAYWGKPVIVTDILRDPLWDECRQLAAPYGLRACWSTPIFSHQRKVLGTFAMYYREPRSPGPAEARLIDIATQIAGIAIERLRAEEALRASEEKYRSFFEEDLAGNYVSTPDGRLLACNPSFARITGFDSVEAAMRESLWARYPSPEASQCFLQMLREHGRLENHEHELRRRDGSPLRVIENAVGRFDERRELVEIHGYVFDDTERRQAEQQLRQAQKMEAVGQLAGGVAHDFNNLLGVITGYSELLQKDIGLQHPGQGRLEQIRRAADRAAGLTRQLLAFSRKQVLAPKVLDLNAVVADVETMLRRLIGEDIQLVTVFDQGLGRVRVDPGQVEQVIVNLAVNARDAMPKGGRLIVETANVDLDDSFPRAHPGARPGPHVMLAVSDTGHGMDPDTQARIFEPFFTTKEWGKGTGLGLATVYGIVKQSGGYIAVDSAPGRGSTFKIYLPRIEGVAEAAVEPRGERESAPGGSETILLLEDEGSLRLIIREVLEAAGYAVLECTSPEEALVAAQADGRSIHLILTDVVMPRMSGREVAERIQAQHPRTKVLYMSGYTDEAISHYGVLDPGTQFIQKPFTTDAVLRRVREVLDRAAEPPASADSIVSGLC